MSLRGVSNFTLHYGPDELYGNLFARNDLLFVFCRRIGLCSRDVQESDPPALAILEALRQAVEVDVVAQEATCINGQSERNFVILLA